MTNKEVVAAMYKEFFNDHDVNAALKYVKEDYIQHNPTVDQGRDGLLRFKFQGASAAAEPLGELMAQCAANWLAEQAR